jgi:hypothetical protein
VADIPPAAEALRDPEPPHADPVYPSMQGADVGVYDASVPPVTTREVDRKPMMMPEMKGMQGM